MTTKTKLVIVGAGVGILWYLSRCNENAIDALAKQAVAATKDMSASEAAKLLASELPRSAPRIWSKCRPELFKALARNGMPPIVMLGITIASLPPGSPAVA